MQTNFYKLGDFSWHKNLIDLLVRTEQFTLYFSESRTENMWGGEEPMK
jgi:hypothetical protein